MYPLKKIEVHRIKKNEFPLLSLKPQTKQHPPQKSEGFFWFYNYLAVNFLGFTFCFHYYPHNTAQFSMLAGLVLPLRTSAILFP